MVGNDMEQSITGTLLRQFRQSLLLLPWLFFIFFIWVFAEFRRETEMSKPSLWLDFCLSERTWLGCCWLNCQRFWIHFLIWTGLNRLWNRITALCLCFFLKSTGPFHLVYLLLSKPNTLCSPFITISSTSSSSSSSFSFTFSWLFSFSELTSLYTSSHQNSRENYI